MATSAPSRLKSQCRRATWAAGVCLGLVFVLGVSGVASITLLYEDPWFVNETRGFEGAVIQTVLALKPLIRFLHTYGGYAAFVLAGWTAIEMFALWRLLRGQTSAESRQAATWVMGLGVIGGAALAGAVALLTVSGIAAAGFLQQSKLAPGEEAAQENPALPGARPAGEKGAEFVEWHTRELTYVVAAAALMLAGAASQARKVAQREAGAAEPEQSEAQA